MAAKLLVIIFFVMSANCCMGGLIPAVPAALPAAYSVPYASSYSAHVINHAIAAPVAAPFVAAAPAVAPVAAYSAFPYTAALPAPLIAG